MGLFRQNRFVVPFRFGARRPTVPALRHRFRSPGERGALAWCGILAFVSIVMAMAWPIWVTIHCAVILSGLVLALYFSPWLEDRDDPTQLKSDHQPLDDAIGEPQPSGTRRRAA